MAIWTLPMTLSVNANRPATTTAARTARIAAGTDHTGIHSRSHGLATKRRLRQEICSPRTVAVL